MFNANSFSESPSIYDSNAREVAQEKEVAKCGLALWSKVKALQWMEGSIEVQHPKKTEVLHATMVPRRRSIQQGNIDKNKQGW